MSNIFNLPLINLNLTQGEATFERLKQFYPNVAIVSSKEVEEAALHTISVGRLGTRT